MHSLHADTTGRADDPTVQSEWDAFVAAHPQAHILQTEGWGALKGAFGWWQRIVTVRAADGTIQAGALVLFRKVAGLTLAYVPKGPLTDWRDDELTKRLLRHPPEAQRQHAIVLKIEPDLPDSGEHRALLARFGFHPSPQTVQPRSTVLLDISDDEDAILARMKSKWRYNVRLAERKDVSVRAGSEDDLRHFQSLMQETGERDAFDVHSIDYYRAAFAQFVPQQGVFLFAEYQGEPLAAIVVLQIGHTAWYLWGASSNRERNRMPNHALQWAAMRWAKDRGATRYDFWGIPDEIGQVAAGMRGDHGDPVRAENVPVDVNAFPEGDLWGVFRFKEGFGGAVERYVGAWDLPINPAGYLLYQTGLKARNLRFAIDDLRFSVQGMIPKLASIPSTNRESELENTLTEKPQTQPEIVNRQSQIVNTPFEWRSILASLPRPHVLQSWEWGEVKDQTGWQAQRFVLPGKDGAPRAAFQFLWRQPLPQVPLRVGYVPKGPVVDWEDEESVAATLDAIQQQCRRLGCLFVKIDPDVDERSRAGRRLLAQLRARGWRFSPEQIQFKNTAYTDLTLDEETLMASFKSKWRYNIRLAERRGVTVRAGTVDDLPAFYDLYAETSRRDGFLVRPFSYYKAVWETFLAAQDEAGNPAGGALLLAEHPEETAPLAGLFLFRYGEDAWYFYGASSDRRRRDMPNHLLQWQAMQWAIAQGCTRYDWWGAPTDLADPNDAMQGVWSFKEGFNAQFAQHVGAWDWSPQPILWQIYHRGMPLVLDWMRGRRNA
ncbi:MAG: peptidoglycan bridge formation glycyltransferase FemA/FemB family protein [Caldilineaceae bacterium]